MMSKESVVHRFAASVAAYPDRPALWARDQLFTYSELSALAETTRQLLTSRQLYGPQRIGVVTGDGASTYAAILAILANGAAYVPINSKNPVARNLDVMREAGVTGLLHEADSDLTRALVGDLPECELIRMPAAVEGTPEELKVVSEDSEALAYLLFTSGSTGKPKGVPIRHKNLNCFLSVMVDSGIYDFRNDDRFLQMFELTFDFSVMSVFVPLCVGACCYVVPDSKFGAAMVLKVMQEHKISVAPMVPSILVFLEPHLETRVRFPDLRFSIFCGEPLPDSLVQKLMVAAPGGRVENVYGPTEATVFCLRYPWIPGRSPSEAVNGVVPIGVPFPGSGALIVDENRTVITGSGIKGELLLTGQQLSPGYWHDSVKTEAAFITLEHEGVMVEAYCTGDICSRADNGNFIYHGRKDAQVKIDGYRVELGEIEHHVRQFLGRTNCAVVVATDNGRSSLVLFIEKPEVNLDDLAVGLKSRVPEYMVPKRVEYLDVLPLNLNGKVDRPALVRLLATL